MRKNLRAKITKQYNLGAYVGGLKEIAMHTASWIGMLNFLLIAITAYHTTLRGFLPYWVNFPIFIGCLVCLVLIAMTIEYKFIMPSVWAFRNYQAYEHNNPMVRDIRELAKRLKELEDKDAN